jgi:hypothetical protein
MHNDGEFIRCGYLKSAAGPLSHDGGFSSFKPAKAGAAAEKQHLPVYDKEAGTNMPGEWLVAGWLVGLRAAGLWVWASSMLRLSVEFKPLVLCQAADEANRTPHPAGNDLPCNQRQWDGSLAPWCRVCGGQAAVEEACNRAAACVAFDFATQGEFANCGYLKSATGPTGSNSGYDAYKRSGVKGPAGSRRHSSPSSSHSSSSAPAAPAKPQGKDGYVKEQGASVQGADISCGMRQWDNSAAPWCRVCGGEEAVRAACDKNAECVAFDMHTEGEFANCGYLKSAVGPSSSVWNFNSFRRVGVKAPAAKSPTSISMARPAAPAPAAPAPSAPAAEEDEEEGPRAVDWESENDTKTDDVMEKEEEEVEEVVEKEVVEKVEEEAEEEAPRASAPVDKESTRGAGYGGDNYGGYMEGLRLRLDELEARAAKLLPADEDPKHVPAAKELFALAAKVVDASVGGAVSRGDLQKVEERMVAASAGLVATKGAAAAKANQKLVTVFGELLEVMKGEFDNVVAGADRRWAVAEAAKLKATFGCVSACGACRAAPDADGSVDCAGECKANPFSWEKGSC